MVPMNELVNRLVQCENYVLCEFQQKLVFLLLKHEIGNRYAPQRSYTSRFLKKYISLIENSGHEVHDELMQEFMLLLRNDRQDDLDLHYLTFSLKEDVTATVRVAGYCNQVGMRIWEAGYYLSEYVLQNADRFCGKRVLELGSGVGLTGISLAVCGNPSYVLLTDYVPQVMLNLEYNIELNMANVGSTILTLGTVDWGQYSKQEMNKVHPDVLICGDCVYDVDEFSNLMNVLHHFFTYDAHVHTRVAIFAVTIRNAATFTSFLAMLDKHHLSYKDIDAHYLVETDRFPNDNFSSIRLCEISYI